MSKRNFFIVVTLLVIFIYPYISHAAGDPFYFRPNITIPGMEQYFDSETVPADVGREAYVHYKIDESGIIHYMQAIYSYSAIMAGVIAMFMMVFAAYQWLMAAGNAEKIGRARDTISGVLLGLTLLFGGYLLLSQISIRLVDLVPIDVPRIEPKDNLSRTACADIMSGDDFTDFRCGDPYTTSTEETGQITCISTKCTEAFNKDTCIEKKDVDTSLCPIAMTYATGVDCECEKSSCQDMFGNWDVMNPWKCGAYKLDNDCMQNKCFGESVTRYSGGLQTKVFDKECGIDENAKNKPCEDLDKVHCFTDLWCQQANLGEDWFCDISGDHECKKESDR